MNTQKAIYWVALALAAFAFNSQYQHGAFPSLHHAASRASGTLCMVSANVERTFAMARLMAARPTIPDDELPSLDLKQFADLPRLSADQREMLRDQMRAQAEMIRTQVMAQQEELRSLARQQVHFTDSMNRRVVMVGPGNCKGSIHVPASSDLPDSDDDDDSF